MVGRDVAMEMMGTIFVGREVAIGTMGTILVGRDVPLGMVGTTLVSRDPSPVYPAQKTCNEKMVVILLIR